MLDVLAILVGLLAIAQFFIKGVKQWTTASKIVTLLLLAIISVLLRQCQSFSTSIIDNNLIESTQSASIEPTDTQTPRPTDRPALTDGKTLMSTFPETEKSTPAVPTVPTKAPDCKLGDANEVDIYYVYHEDSLEDSFGNTYRQEYYFALDNESYIIFSPLGNYERLKGTIAIEKGENSKVNRKIEIFSDDTSIYYMDIKITDGPIQFDLDISGARLIKIVADKGVIIGDGIFYN